MRTKKECGYKQRLLAEEILWGIVLQRVVPNADHIENVVRSYRCDWNVTKSTMRILVRNVGDMMAKCQKIW